MRLRTLGGQFSPKELDTRTMKMICRTISIDHYNPHSILLKLQIVPNKHRDLLRENMNSESKYEIVISSNLDLMVLDNRWNTYDSIYSRVNIALSLKDILPETI